MSEIHHECELEKHIVGQLAAAGWLVGESAQYDKARALYPEDVTGWLKESQAEAWSKLERQHGATTADRVLGQLVKALDDKDGGTLDVLRWGFSIAGAGRLLMSQALPEDGRNAAVVARYRANRLRVVPQLHYSPDNENAIDLGFFINGLPVATVELKTEFTQAVEAAMLQYRQDRQPKNQAGHKEPLLSFRRGAVVHFAMSETDIRMATRLDGEATVFLPFNQGHDGAAGNPPNPAGYPVSYFWERILTKDEWLRIFHRFVLLERKEQEDASGKRHIKEKLIFPRFHQWRAVTRLLQTVRGEGPGQPYLIQHSAGSGKTHTIAWTAHELTRLRQADGQPYFHTVVVVTDRTVLDQQLQEAIKQIEHQDGVVCAIKRQRSSQPKSQQLAQAMLAQTPIIVVTLQTFPKTQELILGEQSLKDRRFAVIIDEAHSSTGGSTADDLRYVLTGQSEEEWDKLTEDERLIAWQSSRRRPENASYFAFTATPKHSTLSLFGRAANPALLASRDNPPVPFDLYTMQQAIEEGFILDVLENYVHYRVALRISDELARAKDQRLDSKAGKRALAKWLSLNQTNIDRKTEAIAKHFRDHVAHLLHGQAKAMVVAPSRAAAVKYALALRRYCEGKEYGHFGIMVAFSGDVPNKEVQDPQFPEDHAFNESNLNPDLGGRDMRKVFDKPTWRIMVVANKFQTGFDQPKLVAMYLDKKVSGIEAVQTLSRLNRTCPGKDKTFVVDFANETETLVAAFRTFYRDARVSDVQDPNIVYTIKQRLDGMAIYTAAEVEAFGKAVVDNSVTHQKLSAITQPATDRYNGRLKQLNEAIRHWERAWETAKRQDDKPGMVNAEARRAELDRERDALVIFTESLSKFVKVYEYVAQLVEFADPPLEAFANYAKLLRKRLKGIPTEQVDLSGLRLTHHAMAPDGGLSGTDDGSDQPPPTLEPITSSGTRDARVREKELLSELIARLNAMLGNGITEQDTVNFVAHTADSLRGDAVLMAQIRNNPREQAIKARLPEATLKSLVEALRTHQPIAMQLLKDEAKSKAAKDLLIDILYETLKSDFRADGVSAE